MCYTRLLGDVVDAELGFALRTLLDKQLDDRLCPISSVSQKSKIGEWFLWGAELALSFRELVRELDEELAVPEPLMLR
jgi:hypothetical protein